MHILYSIGGPALIGACGRRKTALFAVEASYFFRYRCWHATLEDCNFPPQFCVCRRKKRVLGEKKAPIKRGFGRDWFFHVFAYLSYSESSISLRSFVRQYNIVTYV